MRRRPASDSICSSVARSDVQMIGVDDRPVSSRAGIVMSRLNVMYMLMNAAGDMVIGDPFACLLAEHNASLRRVPDIAPPPGHLLPIYHCT